MSRVLYGVSGEGSGHSSRARVLLEHLQAHGHQPLVVSYDRGWKNLHADFDVFETEGLHIATAENKVSLVTTFTENLAKLPQGVRKFRELKERVKEFGPDVVFTDFEPMAAYLALHYKVPLVSVDNQHRMRYMHYPLAPELRGDARITETVIRAMVPRPDVSLVTTFFRGELKNDRTFLFPPILRREVLGLRPEDGDKILVYLTKGFDALLEVLGEFPRESFVVYGSDGGTGKDNLAFRPFSTTGFLDDLAACKAVISTAGFTLMTEALHLSKPFLAVPMAGQFEQELNASLLESMGCGMNCRQPTADAVAAFLYRLPEYRQELATYPRADNTEILHMVDQLLEDDCSLAREFFRKRA